MSSTTLEAITVFARLVTHLFQAARLYPSEHPERYRLEREIETVWQEQRRIWGGISIDIDRGRLSSRQGQKVALCRRTHKDFLAAADEVGLKHLVLPAGGKVSSLILAVEDLAAGRHPAHCVAEGAESTEPSAVSIGSRTQEIPTVLPSAPVEMLRELWSDLVERRWYDTEKVAALIREIASAAGDGVTAPVPLLGRGRGGDAELRHVLDVARLVYLGANALGAEKNLIYEVVSAALLFDIGMLEIPPSLVESSRRLTHKEFRVVQGHTLIGARILLATVEVPELAAVVAFEHHMRPDGKGYPIALGKWAVCDASKLIQVCDVYSALRSDRPSRPALEEEKARELMRSLAGRWVDAKHVEILLNQTIPAGTSPTWREDC